MTATSQALHIFRKDARALRWEIALILVLHAALVAATTRPWNRGAAVPALSVALPIPVASIFSIARLIHTEPLPATRQFWITRPYRVTSLALAKLLFFVVFLILPFLASQSLIL